MDATPKTIIERMQEAEAKIMAAHDSTPKWHWIRRRSMRKLAKIAGGGTFNSVRREG